MAGGRACGHIRFRGPCLRFSPDVQRLAAANSAGARSGTAHGAGDEFGSALRAGIDTHNLPAPLTLQPRPPLPPCRRPVAPPPGAASPSQAVLALTARFGKDQPPITGGLVWRVFSDRPDETGNFKLIREDRSATPNIVLPPGGYVVHVTLGLVSAVKPVTLKAETVKESLRASGGRPAN